MDTLKISTIILIITGAFALVYGGALGLSYSGFNYTEGGRQPDMEALPLSITEKQYPYDLVKYIQYINVLIWAGVGAILIGGFLLIAGRKS
ncbi:MAG: hypothetical protein H6937_05485 [Burkholderiales bacterium]|nr:hypothetical protein [Burkholderiales bacterium]